MVRTPREGRLANKPVRESVRKVYCQEKITDTGSSELVCIQRKRLLWRFAPADLRSQCQLNAPLLLTAVRIRPCTMGKVDALLATRTARCCHDSLG